MNDLDHDLREMFRRREGDVLAPPEAPAGIARRARRRQAGTVLIAAGTALAVGIVAVVATSSFRDKAANDVPVSPPGAGMRTASVGGVTIEFPTEWYLTTYADADPLGHHAVVLTNFGPDLTSDDPCLAMPANGVMLRIYPDHAQGLATPTWPIPLRSAASPPKGCSGDGFEAAWAAPPTDRPYTAEAAIGLRAVSEDRDRLTSAFDGLSFTTAGAEVAATQGTAAVVASGIIGGRPWVLSGVGRGGANPLDLETTQEGGGLSGTGFGEIDARVPTDITFSAAVMHGNLFLTGATGPDVSRVEIRPTDATAFNVDLVDLPASMHQDVRVFVAPMPGSPRGTLTTYDATGASIATYPFSDGQSCSPRFPCESPTQGSSGTVATGTAEGSDWRIVQAADGLNLIVGGEVLGRAAASGDPMSVATYRFGDAHNGTTMVFGFSRGGATSAILYYSGLPSSMQTVVLDDGRLAFWAGLAGSQEPGPQVIVLDASCNVIASIDMETGEAVADRSVTDCAT